MSIYNLDKIFQPASVAVIGASPREGTIGSALVKNILAGGYGGKIYLVNPQYPEISGLPVSPTLSQVKEPIDLAVLATPIQAAPQIMEECVRQGVKAAVIISAGGKEIGEAGLQVEAQIKETAQRGGIRVIGPNCLGVVCSETRLNATFASHMPLPGKMAFVSQSGAICTAILDLSLKEQIGFSHFVSVGSMLDVDFGDLIDFLGNDSRVSSIILYIESLTNFRKFMSAARAVSRVKPIIVLKSGRSPAGAKAASSHTGSLAGEDAVYEAAFQRAGIKRVHTVAELFDCAELLAKQPRPGGPGLIIITNAGGPGVMAADALAEYGLEPLALHPKTLERLNEMLPSFWSRGNPVDILGDADVDRFRRTVEICLQDPGINGLLVMTAPQAMTDPTGIAEALIQMFSGKRVPVFMVWMGGRDVERGREIFNRAGIPTYETPEQAVRAFWHLVSYKQNLELLQEIPPKLPLIPQYDQDQAREIISRVLQEGMTALTEVEAKALLAAYGIPVNRTAGAAGAEEAVRLAEEMGYPVVLKILSRDILHKTDAHGVELNLQGAEDVRQAFERLQSRARAYNPQARLEGVTVQPQMRRSDYELILGSKKDPDFGPVILFGLGGIMTEVLKDHAVALPPLNRALARHLIENTRVYKLLKGYRNRPPADLVLLEEILIRLSQLVTDFPEITELDINPLILDADGAWAVDCRVLVQPAVCPSPQHLVISPYPNQYEKTLVCRGGLAILARPVKPEDAPLLEDLFRVLSARSIYYRFFRPLKEIPPELLARFTQIDYDRDIVLVAVDQSGTGERALGVSRLMGDPDGIEAEFAITVGDPWQGKGVGAALLESCLAIAREKGFKSVWGITLAENTQMLQLAKKLGFDMQYETGTGEYRLQLDLSKVHYDQGEIRC
ncbi:MAG: bifunctional acetate--CoA ligase family protein/GNAT family N-acetyltransferase [Deltaproteobacteria bacterium]|nr:bifunctional acetate--CoA ligase family protein/GNAT family N-acetyltransferase [Deltaproteobacteria bacterium]